MTSKPIFPPDPMEQQRQKTGQSTLWIWVVCVLGAVLIVSEFIRFSFPDVKKYEDLPKKSAAGTNFDLYGKTLENEDFDWKSLRGKYVLVKFTATWCGPCKMEIPGMRDAYKKYHDKGLEIVSVYIWEEEPNAVATVKQFVEREKLPWIILSESLTVKAGQPPQGETFGIQGVPTMLLVDKEGMLISTQARGEILIQELKKVFGE